MKIKKLLMLLISLITLSLTLTACGAVTPEKQAEVFLKSFENMKFDKINKIIQDDENDNFKNLDKKRTDEDKLILEAMCKNIEYSIKSEEINGDNAEVTVDITNINMSKLMKDYITESLESAMAAVINKTDNNFDETESLKRLINDSEKITNTVTIKLVKSEDKWYIVGEETLLDNMMGNYLSFMAQGTEAYTDIANDVAEKNGLSMPSEAQNITEAQQ